ncbi:MAG: elongation factor G [Pseudomonadota bacterium]
MGDDGAGKANGARLNGGVIPSQAHKVVALVGPQGSGKTTLLEALLERCGVVTKAGTVTDGTTVGDRSREARAHQMSVEANLAQLGFLGDTYTFIDCPGSVEFFQDMRSALPVVDAAVVVGEVDEKKVPALRLILHALEDAGIPRLLFLNKIDRSQTGVREAVTRMQPASRQPLVMRQLPIFENGIATGFVDLALERAFVYREHAASEVVPLTGDLLTEELDARFSMLEHLADFDDALMEQLLSDIEPPRDVVFDDLAREVSEGQIVPLLVGSAQNGNGILRLLKALRHDVPDVTRAADRLGIDDNASASPVVIVTKTQHTSHAGKLTIGRVMVGALRDGDMLTHRDDAVKLTVLSELDGAHWSKTAQATVGQLVGLPKLDTVVTGDVLGGQVPLLPTAEPLQPVMARAVSAAERKDEVKLTAAIQKLLDEDPSLSFGPNPDTGDMLLKGQGEMHLRVAIERLSDRFGVAVEARPARIGYKETIRKPVTIRGRHKKQSGGHGQFGDAVVDIKPLPRGTGFRFEETVTGGVVPKQYIPAVEGGVRDVLAQGPLGFPVIDVAVTLTDGSHHSVDSSEQAFRMAGQIAMREGLPQCAPVLLEPVLSVEIAVPSEATPKVNAIISGRRGQILGFEPRPGWDGWDIVSAQLPEAELQDLIIELRSITLGVGSFTAAFDHWQELTGRAADQVLAVAS